MFWASVQTTESDVVIFCNLIGLHSWLQQNKSIYRLDSRPSVHAKVWLCQTKHWLKKF